MAHITWGIIIASGKTEQMSTEVDKEVDTAFLSLGDKPLLAYSLLAMENCDDIDASIVVVKRERMEAVKSLSQMFGCMKLKRIVAGSSQRLSSVQQGLKNMDDDVTMVVLHEVSRPFVTAEMISDVVKAAKRYGCGISSYKLTESVKCVEKGSKVSETIKNGFCFIAQTPQAYKTEVLKKGLDWAVKNKTLIVEESFAMEGIKQEVRLVAGTRFNMKIDTIDDLALAGAVQKIETEKAV